MRPRQPTTDNERPGRPHPPGHGGKDRTAGVPAELIQRRQLEKAVSWTRRERLRCLW